MSEFKYEVGQRVRHTYGRLGQVDYSFHRRLVGPSYIVRFDDGPYGEPVSEKNLRPAPLVRGDVVQREQADSIPEGTVVRTEVGNLRRRTAIGDWEAFGSRNRVSDEITSWPVTVVEPAGGHE